MSSKRTTSAKRDRLAAILDGMRDAMAVRDYATARQLIVEGRKIMPTLIGAGGDNVWQTVSGRIAAMESRPVSAVPAQPEVPAAPVVETQPEDSGPDLAMLATPGGPADGGVSFATITIVHNADRGTTAVGGAKGDGTWALMTSDGQAWNYSRSYVVSGGVRQPGYFRIGHTKGFTADMDRIGYATAALRLGGFTVVHQIDDSGCVAKKSTPARQSRLHHCKAAVLRQSRTGRVTPGMDGNEPVSSVPASAPAAVAPVSAPPAVAPVSAPIVAPVPTPAVAPVSAPPAPAAATPDYASMSDALLLAALISGDTGALAEVQARMAHSAVQHVTAVEATPAPVEVAAAVAAPVAPVAAVAAPQESIISKDGYVEIWFAAGTKRRAEMNPVAKIMRTQLNTHVCCDALDGVTTHVARMNKDGAYKVYADVPTGVDNAEVIKRILSLGFGDPIAVPTAQPVPAAV